MKLNNTLKNKAIIATLAMLFLLCLTLNTAHADSCTYYKNGEIEYFWDKAYNVGAECHVQAYSCLNKNGTTKTSGCDYTGVPSIKERGSESCVCGEVCEEKVKAYKDESGKEWNKWICTNKTKESQPRTNAGKISRYLSTAYDQNDNYDSSCDKSKARVGAIITGSIKDTNGNKIDGAEITVKYRVEGAVTKGSSKTPWARCGDDNGEICSGGQFVETTTTEYGYYFVELPKICATKLIVTIIANVPGYWQNTKSPTVELVKSGPVYKAGSVYKNLNGDITLTHEEVYLFTFNIYDYYEYAPVNGSFFLYNQTNPKENITLTLGSNSFYNDTLAHKILGGDWMLNYTRRDKNYTSNYTLLTAEDFDENKQLTKTLVIRPNSTKINMTDEIGNKLNLTNINIDYKINNKDLICENTTNVLECLIPPQSGDIISITLKKTGFVDNSTTLIRLNNNKIVMNYTFKARLLFKENESAPSLPINGGVMKLYKENELLATGPVKNGYGYLPIDPENNIDQELTAYYIGDGASIPINGSPVPIGNAYMPIDANLITQTSTMEGVITTGGLIKVTVNATDDLNRQIPGLDYYMQSNYTTCRTNTCSFNTLYDDNAALVRINKTGFIGYENTALPTNTGILNLTIRHNSIVYVNPNTTTVTAYNATSNAELTSTQSINGTAYLAAPKDIDFYIKVSKTGFTTKKIDQNFTVNGISQLIIGSDSNRTTLIPDGELWIKAKDDRGTIVSNAVYSAKIGTQTFCTQDHCVFTDLYNSNTTVDIQVSKGGYITNTTTGVNIYSGEVNILLRAGTKVYVTPNGTIVRAYKVDDNSLITMTTTSNNLGYLAVPKDLRFYLVLSKEGYYNYTTSTYIFDGDNQLEVGKDYSKIRLVEIIEIVDNNNQNRTGGTNVTDTTPPADVSQLRYVGIGSTWITFAWTNPTTQDFDHTAVYINGNFLKNTNEETYTAGGLLSNTTYTFKARTVDRSGNPSNGITLQVTTTNANAIPPEDYNNYLSLLTEINKYRDDYKLLEQIGYDNPSIVTSLDQAENLLKSGQSNYLLLTSSAINNVKNQIPQVNVIDEGTTSQKETQNVVLALEISKYENQPYTEAEIRNMLTTKYNIGYEKKIKHFQIDNMNKTLVIITIFSSKKYSDMYIADFAQGQALNAENTIQTSEGTIVYFKGIEQGENVYTYVMNGYTKADASPTIFEMKTLSESEKVVRGITGLSVGVPGVIEVPIIVIVIIIGVILVALKILLF